MLSMRVRGKFLLFAGACLLASLIFAWAAPNVLLWRMAQSEYSVPQGIREINETIKAYINEHGAAPPTLSSLQGRLSSGWSCETTACDRIGYRFQYTVSLQGRGKPRYFLSAEPLQRGITGARSYYLDQSGILRCTNEPRAATSNDSPLRERIVHRRCCGGGNRETVLVKTGTRQPATGAVALRRTTVAVIRT